MKTNTTIMDAMDKYFDIQDGKKYAIESKNGFYGVYVGKEDSGKVH